MVASSTSIKPGEAVPLPDLAALVSSALMGGTLQWLTAGIIPEVPKA
jgi:hypothetical protein